jgi:tocopherol O-methyltransferase
MFFLSLSPSLKIMASMDHFGSAAAEIEVVGITLSSYQQAKATELTAACDDIPAGAVTFRVANALATPFEDGNFDLVWSLESGEHMPDKHEWLAEISRLLRPGGTFLCATWCCREHAYSEFAELAEGPAASPLSQEETVLLGRICKNYSLPKFVPLSTYDAACHDNNLADFAESARSWTTHVLPFWPAVIRSSLLPLSLLRIICSLPCGGWTTLKGAITAKLMMDGFEKGTLNFGVFAVRKL